MPIGRSDRRVIRLRSRRLLHRPPGCAHLPVSRRQRNAHGPANSLGDPRLGDIGHVDAVGLIAAAAVVIFRVLGQIGVTRSPRSALDHHGAGRRDFEAWAQVAQATAESGAPASLMPFTLKTADAPTCSMGCHRGCTSPRSHSGPDSAARSRAPFR